MPESLFLMKLQASGLQLYLKKRFWHRFFPVNFVKFLRTLFLQNTYERLLLFFKPLNAPSNKTQLLTKSMSMDITVVGALNQLFVRGSYTEDLFQKNQVDTGKTPFFVIDPFCTPYSICQNIGP